MGQGLLSEEEIAKRREAVFAAFEERQKTIRQLRRGLTIFRAIATTAASACFILLLVCLVAAHYMGALNQGVLLVLFVGIATWCEVKINRIDRGELNGTD